MNKIQLDSSTNKNIKYDIDNDNLITEEEFKEFKFENSGNNNKESNDEVAEEDYDVFYQMEKEEEMKKEKSFLGKRTYTEAFGADENVDKNNNIKINENENDNNVNVNMNTVDSINSNGLINKMKKI